MLFKTKNAKLAFLFMMVYYTSYLARINYTAVISEMVTSTGMTKPMLSIALTGTAIAYGSGQILSGICGDRFPSKKLVTGGLAVTVAMNLLIPFCTTHYQMAAVWFVNGLAQAFMWPPMVRLMAVFFSEEEYSRYMVRISWGSSFGTISMYLIAPLLISIHSWKLVFFFSAAFGFIMIFVWNRFCEEPAAVRTENKKEKGQSVNLKVLFSPMMLCIMLAIMLHGMLRDGVTTWIPSYIAETYQMSNVVAIFTSVVLPIFSVLAFQLAGSFYRSVFTNPVMCASVFFGTGMFSALALRLFAGNRAILSIVFAAVLTGCMHGVNLILIGMLPSFFKKHGLVATMSGVLNSCTYLGSAVSTYGIALLAENFHWNVTLDVWFIIAVAGTLLCLGNIRSWNKNVGNI